MVELNYEYHVNQINRINELIDQTKDVFKEAVRKDAIQPLLVITLDHLVDKVIDMLKHIKIMTMVSMLNHMMTEEEMLLIGKTAMAKVKEMESLREEIYESIK